jgi:hypothetical protein
MWVMFRLMWPAAVQFHIHPRRRQNWSSLQEKRNPQKMTATYRNLSGQFDGYNKAGNTLDNFWLSCTGIIQFVCLTVLRFSVLHVMFHNGMNSTKEEK